MKQLLLTKAHQKPEMQDLILKYSKLKKLWDRVDDQILLKKYRILSKAYKLGKKIYGIQYSKDRLCKDFEIPKTTVHRILSLQRATPYMMSRFKKGEIGLNKLAFIIHRKSPYFWNEIIDITIKNNLSMDDIKELKVDNQKDLRVARHQATMIKGYASQHTAFEKYIYAIGRLERFTTYKIKDLRSDHRLRILVALKSLVAKLNKVILAMEAYK